MTLQELKSFFKTELSGIYSESECAELCAVFLYEKTGFDKFQQRRFSQQDLLLSDEEDFLEIIQLLKTGKPFQQILGHTEFYGKKFFVDEHVLIPRPETEELLEFAISEIQKHFVILNEATQNEESIEQRDSSHHSATLHSIQNDIKKTIKILDIGTGSGIIPITLKNHFPEAEVSAMDISEKALETAKRNADLHQAKINFIQADYLHTDLREKYDIIISNPPYIAIEEDIEIENSVKDFEPNIALFSPTEDALIFYRKIAEDCQKHLTPNGMFFLEINQKLGKETLDLFQNFSEQKLVKDLSDNDRFVMGKR